LVTTQPTLTIMNDQLFYIPSLFSLHTRSVCFWKLMAHNTWNILIFFFRFVLKYTYSVKHEKKTPHFTQTSHINNKYDKNIINKFRANNFINFKYESNRILI
jgi:hypothetical protein